ncbi:MAG: YhcN/YlaJ family sporulation lipoprotein [Defluviitaleaceae bacterium]|nr:YhcN/YlaJ family sporulation lipoprotein [Defluviitaleaceae bacterium]
MKKSLLLLILMALLASCGAQNHDTEATATRIANYLAGLAEVEDCNVRVDGSVAVVGLSLVREHDDAELIALKKRIVADIKSQNSEITWVAVNTAADMFEDVQKVVDDGHESPEERKIERELKENDEDIFVNVVPTM